MPRGKQKAINGPVVNVPTNIGKVCDFLPRLPGDANIIGLKLKRRLIYRGHYMHQFIRPGKIKDAIRYLKDHNHVYADVGYNTNWENNWRDEEEGRWESLILDESERVDAEIYMSTPLNNLETQRGNGIESTANLPITEENRDITCNEITGDETEDIDTDDQTELEVSSTLRGLPYATLLQPEEFSPDNNIAAIAPAEGEKPIPILTDQQFEAMAFPNLFPHGSGTLSDDRNIKLTARKYFNQRLLDVDGRFAKDIDYL